MKIKKFQEGGAAPAAPAQPQGNPAAPAGGSPEEQLAGMAQQIVEQLGPEAAGMLAQMIMQMLQGAAQPAAEGQPVYAKKGGKLVMLGRR